jgi:hypothetical protein
MTLQAPSNEVRPQLGATITWGGEEANLILLHIGVVALALMESSTVGMDMKCIQTKTGIKARLHTKISSQHIR